MKNLLRNIILAALAVSALGNCIACARTLYVPAPVVEDVTRALLACSYACSPQAVKEFSYPNCVCGKAPFPIVETQRRQIPQFTPKVEDIHVLDTF